jgi:hypothetical protein
MHDGNIWRRREPHPTKALALALVLAGSIGGGGATAALAQVNQPPPSPQPNRAWGGCVLPQTVIDAIKGLLPASSFDKTNTSFQVDYIVVRAVANPNGGQPLKNGAGGGFSGPIVCVGPNVVPTTTFATTVIPDGLSPNGGATSTDILGTQEDFILRYTLKPTNRTENRYCDATAGNNECFRLRSSP